jgi:hypothetical protein
MCLSTLGILSARDFLKDHIAKRKIYKQVLKALSKNGEIRAKCQFLLVYLLKLRMGRLTLTLGDSFNYLV